MGVYVGTFWADLTDLRPIAGTLMQLAIGWFAVWAFLARAGAVLTVPRLSMLLASINLVIGAVLGVILGLRLAGTIDIGDEVAGVHPAMTGAGHLILAGVALDEPLLVGSEVQPVTRAGWQALLFFLAEIALAVGILFDVQPLLGLNLLGEVAGS
jgi:hypothetical protein